MGLSIKRVATGLDNEKGKVTRLFLIGTGFAKHNVVEIREIAGAGLWTGKIQHVYDDGLAIAHVKTIQESSVHKDGTKIEIDEENIEIIVTDETDTATGSGSIPIFP